MSFFCGGALAACLERACYVADQGDYSPCFFSVAALGFFLKQLESRAFLSRGEAEKSGSS
jgi:hypothetical protein